MRYLLVLTFLCFGLICQAQTVKIDPSFNATDSGYGRGDGPYYLVSSMLVQQDGKVLLGGMFTMYNMVPSSYVARTNSDGTIDTSFSAGTFPANTNIYSIERQVNGKILVGGNFSSIDGISYSRLTRLNLNGRLDTSFHIGTGFNADVWAIVALDNGSIIVGGDFTSYNGAPANYLVRLNPDGTRDNSFNTETNGPVTAMGRMPDGSVYIGGNFTSVNSTGRNFIARLLPNGSLDNGFIPTNLNDKVSSLALQPDGKLLVTGYFTSISGGVGRGIARMNTDGSLDAGFTVGTGINGNGYSVGVLPNGKIVLAGSFTQYNGSAVNRLVLLQPNGARDPGFASGALQNMSTYHCVAASSDNRLYVGGNFMQIGNTSRVCFTRLQENGSVDPSHNVQSGFNETSVFHNPEAIRFISYTGGSLLVGGQFSHYNGTASQGLALVKSDGAIDPGFFAPTMNGSVKGLARQADGKIIVAGSFSLFNGQTVNGLVRIQPNGLLDPSFSAAAVSGSYEDVVVQPNGKILLGGSITSYGGTGVSRIIRLNADGTQDLSFNTSSGFNNWVLDIDLQPDGRILVAGRFTEHNGVARNRIARLLANGSLDTSFDPGSGTDAPVYKVQYQGNDSIYINGIFISYNGRNASRIARLKNNGAIDTSFNTGSGFDGNVRDLVALPGGRLLACGFFNQYRSVSYGGLMMLHADGMPEPGFRAGTGARGISLMQVQNDGKIMVGGTFTSFDGVGRNRLARLVYQPLITGSISTATVCAGSAINIPVTTSLSLPANHIFSAELSNASGSFSNPIVIGMVTASTSTSINATIPANTAAGTGYQVRIVSNAAQVPPYTIPATFSILATGNCNTSITPVNNAETMVRLLANPVRNEAKLELRSSRNTVVSWKVFNSAGMEMMVFETKLIAGTRQVHAINTSGLPGGLYFIEGRTGNGALLNLKMVKQ